jgi:VanZ family protein
MLPLRLPKAWLVSGVLLILVVCFGSLMPGNLIPIPYRWDKINHLGGYLGLMLWFCGMYPRSKYPMVAAGLLLLGISLEVLQRWGGHRTFELLDIAANSMGLIIGWWLAIVVFGGWCLKLEQLVFHRS